MSDRDYESPELLLEFGKHGPRGEGSTSVDRVLG